MTLLRADRRPGSRVLGVLAALAATLGCAAWFATIALGEATMAATERLLARGALPSLLLTGPPDDLDRALRIVRDQVPVRSELPRAWQRFPLDPATNGGVDAITLCAVQLAQEAMAHRGRASVRGELPRDGEVLLDAGTAARLHLEPGGALRADPHATPLRVSGVFVTQDEVRGIPPVGFVTFATLGALRGSAHADAIECALGPDVDPDRALTRLRDRLPPTVHASTAGLRQEAKGAARAVRATVDLAGWIALCLGLLATAAATRDTLRHRASSLELQRDLGVPPRVTALQWCLPAALQGALAFGAGALLGRGLAGRLLPGLEAFTSIQVGHGVVLPHPSAFGMSPVLACTAGAATSVLAAGFGTRRAHLEATSRGGLGALALLASATLALSGATALHPLLRALDVALAAGAIGLLVRPVLAIAARALSSPQHALHASWLHARPGSVVAALRLCALGITFATALLSIRRSLAAGIDAEALRRFPGATVLRSTAELFGADIGGSIELDSTRVRALFRSSAELGLDTLAQFVWITLALAFAAATAFTIAGVRERRDDFELLRDLGVPPRFLPRLALGTWTLGAASVACVALAIGGLLGWCWTVGPLRDALGIAVPWRADATTAIVIAIASVPPVALVAAASARLPYVTAWRVSRSQPRSRRCRR